jgi:hypothetical protein
MSTGHLPDRHIWPRFITSLLPLQFNEKAVSS